MNHTCCQLQDLELSSAEINISTDGGSYVIAACKKLGAPRLSCFPHLLNLVVANDTIKKSEINPIFTAMSKHVKNFKKSDGNTKLELAQRKAGKKNPLAPVQRRRQDGTAVILWPPDSSNCTIYLLG